MHMQSYFVRRFMIPLSVLSATCTVCNAEGLFFVTTTNELLVANTETPGTILSSVPITGLAAGESVVAIDCRPGTPAPMLYILGSSSRLYTVADPARGEAIPVGDTFSPKLNGTDFGFDFDPVEDVIHIMSDSNQGLEVDPNTGIVLGVDHGLSYVDAYSDYEPYVVGIAYTRSAGASLAAQLYLIDSGLDLLVTHDGNVRGQVTAVGPLGVDAGSLLGFDISNDDDVAYAAFEIGDGTGLFEIDLRNGHASLLASLSGDHVVRAIGLSGAPGPVPVRSVSWGGIKANYRRAG